MRLIQFSLFIFLIFFISCGNDRGDRLVDIPKSCSIEEENRFVYEYMISTYYWSDKIDDIDYLDTKYRSIELLLDDLIYKDLDKWSYVTTTKSYDSYFNEGEYIGLGFSQILNSDENETIIRFVYPNSPADKAGLKRGDRVLKINGISILDIQTYQIWSNIYGEDRVGESVELYIKDKNGLYKDINISKEIISIQTVLYKDIINIENKKVGYFVFQNFIEPSTYELDELFSYFKQESIDELILDLRYNSGGRVHVANHLASLIGGENLFFKVFTNIIHNPKSIYSDYSILYQTMLQNSLNLKKVYILITNFSCSASELVINSLKASQNGIDVIVIGENSCGKPVGMYGVDFCDKHLAPIQFSLKNGDFEGDYFDGIEPRCRVNETIDKEFGDLNDSLLKESLYYIKNGRCSQKIDSRSLYKGYKQIPLYNLQREINAF